MFRRFGYDCHLHDQNETHESVKALMKAHMHLFSVYSFHSVPFTASSTGLHTCPSTESQSSLDFSTQDKFLGLVCLGQGLEGMEGTSWVLS